jgi:AbrB family looped-hinge helix DNA binding protein
MKPSTVAIDKAGRLVLPKPLRERLRLHAGSQLEIEFHGDHLRLRPVDQGPALAQVNGWWVHRGIPASEDALLDALERHRDDRLGDLTR